MKVHILSFMLIFLLFNLVRAKQFQDFTNITAFHRRILHQPLFPATPTPPPGPEPPPSSPPPPPPTPTPTKSDHPFFHENPNGQTPDQLPPPPPAAVAANNTATHPIAPQPANKPAKKIAVAISVGIVTLGMLSALAFFIYKHKLKQQSESLKLAGVNSLPGNQENLSRNMPPATFLYIGTVEPSRSTTSDQTTNGTLNDSPYNKLNSIKRSDRYRPSPELQPLPRLSKPPPPPPATTSPPAMSSSDEEEIQDFYTPQGSSASTDDGFSVRSLKQGHRRNKKDKNSNFFRSTSPLLTSKRTSPRSRLSVSSSPDTKHTSPSSDKIPPAAPPPPPLLSITNGPRRAKFGAPPPGPDMTRLHSVNNNYFRQKPEILVPPPPPPPPLTAPEKLGVSPIKSMSTSSSSQSMSPTPKVIPKIVKRMCIEEVNKDGVESGDLDGSKPKLKPLHWDKVRATSDRATVWDQLKSSSFQLNEDIMESLFGCNSGGSAKKEDGRKSGVPPAMQENRVLDPKKSQNIAILLRALNVTQEEVSEALLEGNSDGLGGELLETLVKMAPTKEEEIKLRDYKGDISKLGSAERFLKAILDIPFAFKRVEAMLYRANFENEVKFLRSSFHTLEAASEELKSSRLFLKLLEAVLRTGNRMNVGTNRGEATAFKLDTLLKLVDIKGTDGKTTLLHFVVQEIIRSEDPHSDTKTKNLPTNPTFNEGAFKKQGLQIVGGLSRELGHVKKAAGMDSDVLSGYVAKLEMGIQKIRLVGQETPEIQENFFRSMRIFLKEAEVEIAKIKIDEKKALVSVQEVTAYFHGDTAKEGAYPLRIFTIVRDFLGILDHVCKEVGQMQDRIMVGSARSFRAPTGPPLLAVSRYNVHHSSSSDEESSYSSP